MERILIAMPYRDAYFVRQFGMAVRDVRVIDEIRRIGYFDDIVIVNRPVSIYERALLRKQKSHSKWPHLTTLDYTASDIVGPFRGRRWISNLYSRYLRRAIQFAQRDRTARIVLLDFHPFALIGRADLGNSRALLWHDAIDNFTKHPRFSRAERVAVGAKYTHVRNTYDFVSGVTDAVCNYIGHPNSFAFGNGLYAAEEDRVVKLESSTPTFDFGFIGFVTNKFDIDFIERLLAEGFAVAVYGKILDTGIRRKLRRTNAYLGGAFDNSQISSVIRTFKVGLIPYLPRMEHEGSPLKLYEYMRLDRPVLTSVDYVTDSPFVKNYRNATDLRALARSMLSMAGDREISRSIEPASWLSHSVRQAIDRVEQTLCSRN